jgi:hypothetical protein
VRPAALHSAIAGREGGTMRSVIPEANAEPR